MLLSTGERVSCALCAMAINDLGHRAISLTGSQAGIVTDTSHTKARILEVRADRIRDALAEDAIVLVAGFQGVSTAKDVTTLGRGGSDTTAVALAAAVGADVCEIYTDVDGVFTSDPRIVPEARKLPYVTFEEMLEMAASGAGVLQLRSVEYARNHGVRIHCRSSFHDRPGTVVIGEDETVEQPLITAVTHSTGEARVTLLGVPDTPGVAGRIFTSLAEAQVNVDMIIQNEPVGDALAELSFTVSKDDLRTARTTLEPLLSGARRRRHGRRRDDGEGVDRRCGNEEPSRRRRARVPDARHRGDQHRDDLDLAHQDLVRDRRRARAARGPLAARGVRAGGPRHDPAGAALRPVRAMSARDGYRVAVAGATGAVGTLMLEVLRRSSLPVAEVVPFATERSEGRTLELADAPVRVMRDDTIEGFDLALFSAYMGSTSREWAPRFVGAGAVVVDNSSAWRMHDHVPLVVSEVNPDALGAHEGSWPTRTARRWWRCSR